LGCCEERKVVDLIECDVLQICVGWGATGRRECGIAPDGPPPCRVQLRSRTYFTAEPPKRAGVRQAICFLPVRACRNQQMISPAFRTKLTHGSRS
jgi:hypothetical protein